MPLLDKQMQFMDMITSLLVYLRKEGIRVVGGDLWRSTDPLPCPHCKTPVSYQELLLNAGRTKVKYSNHGNRLAIDLILHPGDDAFYFKAGLFWEALGGRWGGRYGVKPEFYKEKIGWDRYHFELPN